MGLGGGGGASSGNLKASRLFWKSNVFCVPNCLTCSSRWRPACKLLCPGSEQVRVWKPQQRKRRKSPVFQINSRGSGPIWTWGPSRGPTTLLFTFLNLWIRQLVQCRNFTPGLKTICTKKKCHPTNPLNWCVSSASWNISEITTQEADYQHSLTPCLVPPAWLAAAPLWLFIDFDGLIPVVLCGCVRILCCCRGGHKRIIMTQEENWDLGLSDHFTDDKTHMCFFIYIHKLTLTHRFWCHAHSAPHEQESIIKKKIIP